MKKIMNSLLLRVMAGSALFLFFLPKGVNAQEDTLQQEAIAKPVSKPVKNTFESVWLMDNQTVLVPVRKTFQIDIQHRFGVMKNGFDDVYGLFAPSNIRIGLSYTPINKLMVGAGLTKERKQLDVNLKYALFTQTINNHVPVSVSYYVNMATELLGKSNYRNTSDRFAFFNQLIIARKITKALSIQVAPNLTHYNNVEAYVDSKGTIRNKMNNDHFAVSVGGRYKFNEKLALDLGYDQPITSHPANNPYPNISAGLEVITSAHSFQFFIGNYSSILPQRNNMFNQNNFSNGQILVGFNITRLWNY
jgi:hypothetical protein